MLMILLEMALHMRGAEHHEEFASPREQLGDGADFQTAGVGTAQSWSSWGSVAFSALHQAVFCSLEVQAQPQLSHKCRWHCLPALVQGQEYNF